MRFLLFATFSCFLVTCGSSVSDEDEHSVTDGKTNAVSKDSSRVILIDSTDIQLIPLDSLTYHCSEQQIVPSFDGRSLFFMTALNDDEQNADAWVYKYDRSRRKKMALLSLKSIFAYYAKNKISCINCGGGVPDEDPKFNLFSARNGIGILTSAAPFCYGDAYIDLKTLATNLHQPIVLWIELDSTAKISKHIPVYNEFPLGSRSGFYFANRDKIFLSQLYKMPGTISKINDFYWTGLIDSVAKQTYIDPTAHKIYYLSSSKSNTNSYSLYDENRKSVFEFDCNVDDLERSGFVFDNLFFVNLQISLPSKIENNQKLSYFRVYNLINKTEMTYCVKTKKYLRDVVPYSKGVLLFFNENSDEDESAGELAFYDFNK